MNTDEYYGNNKPKKKIYIYLIFLLVLLGAAGYVFFIKKDKKMDTVEDKEFVIADVVKVNKSNLKLTKGATTTFTISVNGVAGIINAIPSDSNIIEVTTNTDDCNGIRCFYDALFGNDHTIEYTVTAKENGEAFINVELEDVLTFNEEAVTGSGKIKVLIK